MSWFWIIVIGLLVLAFGLLAYSMRHHVCIRRKDCCGRGCGCLFPVKAPDSKPPQ
jgi:hypothetical protein